MATSRFDYRDPKVLAQILLVAGYLGLVIYANSTGDPTARLAVDVVFGVAILGLGAWILYGDFGTPLAPVTGAVFVGAGIAQAAAIAGIGGAESISTILFFAGLGLYLYLRTQQ